MFRTAITIAALGIGATIVYAQNLDAIKSRRDVMRAIATAGTTNFKMMKGEAPFDLAKVQAGLKENGRRYRRVPQNLATAARIQRSH